MPLARGHVRPDFPGPVRGHVRVQVPDLHPRQLVFLVPGLSAEARVRNQEIARPVVDVDHRGRLLEQRLELGLRRGGAATPQHPTHRLHEEPEGGGVCLVERSLTGRPVHERDRSVQRPVHDDLCAEVRGEPEGVPLLLGPPDAEGAVLSDHVAAVRRRNVGGGAGPKVRVRPARVGHRVGRQRRIEAGEDAVLEAKLLGAEVQEGGHHLGGGLFLVREQGIEAVEEGRILNSFRQRAPVPRKREGHAGKRLSWLLKRCHVDHPET